MEKPTKDTRIEKLLFGLILILIILTGIFSCVPPVSRDALIHHLRVPALYLKHGGIYEIPSLSASYYPMNLELLYIIPLWVGNDIWPKFIHFSFALLTALFIFWYFITKVERKYALVGVFLFLSLPIIVKLSVTVYVDLGLVFFATAALLAYLRWAAKDFSIKYLVVSAVMCGLAMGTKYNGLVVFLILTLFVTFTYARLSPRKKWFQLKALGWGLFFMMVALMIFSPWMIRNMVWTGNPIYPLYKSVFVSPKAVSTSVDGGVKKEQRPQVRTKGTGHLSHFYVRKMIFKESWYQIALIPVRIFFTGRDDHPKYFDGRLNPYLFFFPFLSLFGFRRDTPVIKREKIILAAFAVVFLLIVFFQTDMRIRYIAPVIPPLVILSVFGFKDAMEFISRRYKKRQANVFSVILCTLLIVMVGFNLSYIWELNKTIAPVTYLGQQVGRDEYIEMRRPEYAALKYVNENLAGDTKILGVFIGGRGYYCDREIVFVSNFIWDRLKKSRSAEDMYQAFLSEKLTHLLIRNDLFLNKLYSFYRSEEPKMAAFFQDHTRMIFSKNGYELYRLKNQTVE